MSEEEKKRSWYVSNEDIEELVELESERIKTEAAFNATNKKISWWWNKIIRECLDNDDPEDLALLEEYQSGQLRIEFSLDRSTGMLSINEDSKLFEKYPQLRSPLVDIVAKEWNTSTDFAEQYINLKGGKIHLDIK